MAAAGGMLNVLHHFKSDKIHIAWLEWKASVSEKRDVPEDDAENFTITEHARLEAVVLHLLFRGRPSQPGREKQ